jgi:hypothetical protein
VTDHFACDCPNAEKDDGSNQKYVRGCNAVAITSMVIPPDTLEPDDQLCDLSDPMTGAEETLLLSDIKDTSKAVKSTSIRDTVLMAASQLPK